MALSSSGAAADTCPATPGSSTYFDDVVKAVRGAATCAAASALAEACAMGSSGDNLIVLPALEKCEADFLPKLSDAQKKEYEAKRTACAKKEGEGTIAISERAYCALGVAKDLAKEHGGKAAGPACPAQLGTESFIDDVGKAIRAAPSCVAGAAIAEACALGSSGDVQIAGAAAERCEQTFHGKLRAAQKKGYRKKKAACAKKYARREGTMYVSMAAFCLLEAAKDFAKKHGGEK